MITFSKNESLSNDVDYETIQAKVLKVLKLLDLDEYELAVRFETDHLLKELNNKYRGINVTTDVLSFESKIKNLETGKTNLGDIIISTEKAKIQAVEKKHTIDYEILFLIVHGLLHLLDYDHDNKKRASIMESKQNELINAISG